MLHSEDSAVFLQGHPGFWVRAGIRQLVADCFPGYTKQLPGVSPHSCLPPALAFLLCFLTLFFFSYHALLPNFSPIQQSYLALLTVKSLSGVWVICIGRVATSLGYGLGIRNVLGTLEHFYCTVEVWAVIPISISYRLQKEIHQVNYQINKVTGYQHTHIIRIQKDAQSSTRDNPATSSTRREKYKNNQPTNKRTTTKNPHSYHNLTAGSQSS